MPNHLKTLKDLLVSYPHLSTPTTEHRERGGQERDAQVSALLETVADLLLAVEDLTTQDKDWETEKMALLDNNEVFYTLSESDEDLSVTTLGYGTWYCGLTLMTDSSTLVVDHRGLEWTLSWCPKRKYFRGYIGGVEGYVT